MDGHRQAPGDAARHTPARDRAPDHGSTAHIARTAARSGPKYLPGDPRSRSAEGDVDAMIRVDQAGEYGARRIYEGQLRVLGKGPRGDVLRHMHAQELEHLDTFNTLMTERRVRPTALAPLWHVAGFALGAGTALLGERAAMACTVAVEETIDAHYATQRDALPEDESALRDTIERFRQEELEHRDIGVEHGAHGAPGYGLLTGAIKRASKVAIWLSERI